jgi:hypothetical protein
VFFAFSFAAAGIGILLFMGYSFLTENSSVLGFIFHYPSDIGLRCLRRGSGFVQSDFRSRTEPDELVEFDWRAARGKMSGNLSMPSNR